MSTAVEQALETAGQTGTLDWIQSKVESGEKFSADDLTVAPDAGEIHVVANVYLAGYAGDFEFLRDVKRRAIGRAADQGIMLGQDAERVSPMKLTSPGEAKGILNCLLAEIRKQEAQGSGEKNPDPVTEVGLYLHGGKAFKVKLSGAGRLYALQLVIPSSPGGRAHFVYAAGMAFQIRSSERITLEQARAFAGDNGYCVNCGAFLSDPQSIERGIGPVCEKRILGNAPKRLTGKAAPKSDVRLAKQVVTSLDPGYERAEQDRYEAEMESRYHVQ